MLGHADVRRRYARGLDGFALSRLSAPELRARAALDVGLHALGSGVREQRLALYRAYVGGTVTGVSPLLPSWCGHAGIDLDEAAWRLAPDRPWVRWLCGPAPADPRAPRWGHRSAFRPGPGEAAYHDLRRFAHSGVVIRRNLRGDGFGIRVLHDRLEFGLFLGNARIRTFGVGGAIQLPDAMPATLASALPGRPLDALVGHPLLEGAGCVVTQVDEPTRWGTKVHFRVAPRPWRLPWVRA